MLRTQEKHPFYNLYQARLIAHNKNFSASPCPRVSPNYEYLTGHDITGGRATAKEPHTRCKLYVGG
ncbi:MAG: hypothetical protein AB1861_21545 [Cyanobacteriota bacterium]